MNVERTPVLIVGGSVVGASAALFLAARGISPVLVEKHPSVSTRLRAKVFYPRTMEAYRAVGADQDVYARQHSLPPADHAAVVESLAGPELRRWLLPAARDFSDVSPSPSALVKQADLEEIVRAHAREHGADLRFGHRFLDLARHDDRVVARVLDAEGEPYLVEAGYLLAADGNGSGIRESLGIGRTGEDVVSHVREIGFEADLRGVLAGRRLAMAWAGPAFVSWSTAQDRGAVSVPAAPGVDVDAEAVVSQALGLPSAAVTITGSRPWRMSGWVADAYRAGRVFLLGDAAHVTPPVGGFGANAGIQDAWNLAAKLVSILRDGASPRLLDSYEPERRPIGELTVAQAVSRVGDRGGEHLSEAAVAVGYRYPSPLTDGPLADEPGRWRGEPGTRLPHVWLNGSSTLDLVRDGRYLLLTTDDSQVPDTAADVVRLPRDADRFGIENGGALLVRPDHVVAWRGSAPRRAPASDTAGHGVAALPVTLLRPPVPGARFRRSPAWRPC
ncbi:FAD-dependent monooxygenase [Amycolatopsis sp. OK19-0408]|uniref:FAD-dependent monooxygenase n=1 Tax=Amycolatopsis iheyensis TaxID=2945988 RepID=A0A9X2NH92_9PSEU|nr:FAD-dependent monooxygenase [Amycolatopsis iheyensis]MCR6487752.1 FAD-dependent monooxygenase [Amycolatopsis iheyensis]